MAILTKVSEDELRALAGAFDLGPLSASRGIEAGTVNTSYALELGAKGRYFLRIYEEQDAEGAAREAALLLHLARAGVPTPAPVPDRAGALVRTVAGKPAALFPWVDGDMLCQRAVTAEAAREVGAALARVHLAGAPPGAGTLGPGRFGPADLAVRCARVATSSDPDARALAETLRAQASRAADARARAEAARAGAGLPSGLVHGDLFRDNVLWSGGQVRIAALLDFESAHHGPFAYDVAVTVLSWAYGDRLLPAIARALVAGYRAVRELEPEEREALHDEALLAATRFTITRITDDAIRVGKRWQRFLERRAALEQLGPAGLREVLGL
jgi:homoserine kinase type II